MGQQIFGQGIEREGCADGSVDHAPAPPLHDKGQYGGDIRIDPAPRWNRTNDAILVPGISKNGTRQIFMIRVKTSE